jgi:sugar phosphate isomerase/epimerase
MRTDIIPRVSICQFSTYRWAFEEDVIRYATHGFDSIGVWRRKIEDFLPEAAIDLLYESRMSVSSVHWAGGFTGDGRSFADSIEDAIEAIQLAGCMDADCLILHPGARNGHTTTHARRLLNSALNTLVPIASDYGVKLALEPMLSQRAPAWTFMDCFEDSLDVASGFSADQVGIVLDTYHVGFDPVIFEMLDQFVERIELVQLADRNLLLDLDQQPRRGNESYRMLLGKGQVPIEAWLGKLQQLNYVGKYEVEIHGVEMQNVDYFHLLNSTADYFASPKINGLLKTLPQLKTPSTVQRADHRWAD